MTTKHMRMSIEGALDCSPKEFRRRFQGAVTDDEGRLVSPEAFRLELEMLQAKGHRYFPMSRECEGFDPFEKGCPGHPDLDNELAVVERAGESVRYKSEVGA